MCFGADICEDMCEDSWLLGRLDLGFMTPVSSTASSGPACNTCKHLTIKSIDLKKKEEAIPSRERIHIPPGEKENHRLKSDDLVRGYVRSQEGILAKLLKKS